MAFDFFRRTMRIPALTLPRRLDNLPTPAALPRRPVHRHGPHGQPDLEPQPRRSPEAAHQNKSPLRSLPASVSR